MKKYFFLIGFIIFALIAVLLGPFMANAGSSYWYNLLTNVIIFGSLILMLVSGILASVKAKRVLWVKIVSVILVIIATLAAFVAIALQMPSGY